jgi:hypothetical protein
MPRCGGGNRKRRKARPEEKQGHCQKETPIARRLRAARLRPTLARLSLLEIFRETPGLPDAGMLYQEARDGGGGQRTENREQ